MQFGVHAGLSSRRSRVQIPSGPRRGSHPAHGRVAQLVERAPEKREVTGSMPVPTTHLCRPERRPRPIESLRRAATPTPATFASHHPRGRAGPPGGGSTTTAPPASSTTSTTAAPSATDGDHRPTGGHRLGHLVSARHASRSSAACGVGLDPARRGRARPWRRDTTRGSWGGRRERRRAGASSPSPPRRWCSRARHAGPTRLQAQRCTHGSGAGGPFAAHAHAGAHHRATHGDAVDNKRPNRGARARTKKEARIPQCFWRAGSPLDQDRQP